MDAPIKSKYYRYIATFESRGKRGKEKHHCILGNIVPSHLTPIHIMACRINFMAHVIKVAEENGVLRKDIKLALVEDVAFREMINKTS